MLECSGFWIQIYLRSHTHIVLEVLNTVFKLSTKPSQHSTSTACVTSNLTSPTTLSRLRAHNPSESQLSPISRLLPAEQALSSGQGLTADNTLSCSQTTSPEPRDEGGQRPLQQRRTQPAGAALPHEPQQGAAAHTSRGPADPSPTTRLCPPGETGATPGAVPKPQPGREPPAPASSPPAPLPPPLTGGPARRLAAAGQAVGRLHGRQAGLRAGPGGSALLLSLIHI